MERSGTNALGVRRPARESSITPCRGERLCPPVPCHSEPVRTLAWESVPPRLPLRERCQREALTEGEMPRVFLSPSRLRRQPPPRGGLTARHRRADGTSGRRPLQKQRGAPCGAPRVFRPCVAQTEEGYIRRFYKREPRGIPPKGRKGANLPGNDIPRVFYFPIIYFQRKYASTAFPTVTSRQSKGTSITYAL